MLSKEDVKKLEEELSKKTSNRVVALKPGEEIYEPNYPHNSSFRVITKGEYILYMLNMFNLINIETVNKNWDRIRKGHNFILQDSKGGFWNVDSLDKMLAPLKEENKDG